MEGLPRWNAPCKLLPEFRSQALRPIFYLGSVVISNRRYLAVTLQPSFVVGNLTYCFVHKLLHNRVGFYFKALQLVVKVVKQTLQDTKTTRGSSTAGAECGAPRLPEASEAIEAPRPRPKYHYKTLQPLKSWLKYQGVGVLNLGELASPQTDCMEGCFKGLLSTSMRLMTQPGYHHDLHILQCCSGKSP